MMNYSEQNFDEQDMDFMGGEENEYGEWEETIDTIVDAQQREVLNFLSTVSAEELNKLDRYVKNTAGSGGTVDLNDLKLQVATMRSSGETKQGEPSIAELLKNKDLSLKEREQILKQNNLYKNPREHYFEGKPLPGVTKTSQDRSKEFFATAETYQPKVWKVREEKSRGTSSRPYTQVKDTEPVNQHYLNKDFTKFGKL